MFKRLLISLYLKLRQTCRDHTFSFNKHLLKAYLVLGIILGIKNKVVHNMGKIPTFFSYRSLSSGGKQLRYVKYIIY